jgi:hypothetical protein
MGMDAVVDHHHLYGYGGGGRIEVEAFVADRQRPDLPMVWDVVVEMIATAVAIVVVAGSPRDWDRGGGGGGHYGGGGGGD